VNGVPWTCRAISRSNEWDRRSVVHDSRVTPGRMVPSRGGVMTSRPKAYMGCFGYSKPWLPCTYRFRLRPDSRHRGARGSDRNPFSWFLAVARSKRGSVYPACIQLSPRARIWYVRPLRGDGPTLPLFGSKVEGRVEVGDWSYVCA